MSGWDGYAANGGDYCGDALGEFISYTSGGYLEDGCQQSGSLYAGEEETIDIDDTEITEGACKQTTMCPACPSNNNYNSNYSYEIAGGGTDSYTGQEVAAACGSWSVNNCMTVDGAEPEPGQFVLVGSAQQVWMVWNVQEATTDTSQDKTSTGCPEQSEPQGSPSPEKPKPGEDKPKPEKGDSTPGAQTKIQESKLRNLIRNIIKNEKK